jgi:hypothetical protein
MKHAGHRMTLKQKFDFEVHITTAKYISAEAETLEEAEVLATNEARKHMGADWKALHIYPAGASDKCLVEKIAPDG